MKTFNPNNCSNIGGYIYSLARNLLQAKRNVRTMRKHNAPEAILEFSRGVENEAHNRYYGAKETFWEEIEKFINGNYEKS